MAEEATIARPYAAAVFGLAKGQTGGLDRWTRMLAFAATAVANEQVEALLANPAITATRKAQSLIDICGSELDDRAKNFMHVLAQNKRLSLLPEVASQFEALRAEAERVLDVEVVSAFAMSDSETQTISAALEKKFERKVEMTTRVDAALLGGAVIHAGDTVIDGSVKGRLEKLRETLTRP